MIPDVLLQKQLWDGKDAVIFTKPTIEKVPTRSTSNYHEV